MIAASLYRASDIASALDRQAQRLSDGGYLVRCPVKSHGKRRGDRNRSLCIADGKHGPLFHCFAGCSFREVFDELRRLGITTRTRYPPQRRPAEPFARGSVANGDAYESQQRRKAAWLWLQRQPITGSIAEAYLISRGINGPWPETLAFLPPMRPEHHPAMIACFGIPDESEPEILGRRVSTNLKPIAVHLTLLRANGNGKAHTEPNKLIIGRTLGRPIVVGPINDLLGLVITEGVEDALSAHASTGVGAWAAASAGMMPNLADAVPTYIECVTIYAHTDRAGQKGAQALGEKLVGRGIEVFIEGLIF